MLISSGSASRWKPLGRLRNAADYQLSMSSAFLSARVAVSTLADAEAAASELDAIDADPGRRAVAMGSLPP